MFWEDYIAQRESDFEDFQEYYEGTFVYRDVNVNALRNYIMIVYTINHLAVFESFIPGNAYYVFRYDDMDVLLEEISHMTKSQMMLAEYSTQRGNHISNRDKLKIKIDKLFE